MSSHGGNLRWGRRQMVAVTVLAVTLAGLVGCTNPPGNATGVPPTTIAPLPGPPGSFTVLSYNVAGLPEGISSAHPQWSMPIISPLLNTYDVVLTQEDFDWWQPIAGVLDFAHYHQRLRSRVTHPYRSAQHPGPLAVGLDPSSRPLLVGDGLGWLSRFPFVGERRVPWRGCFGGALPDGGASDCLAMKGFGVVRMTLADGFDIDVYNLHGEAGGTAADQRLQRADYVQLAEFIREHSAGRAVVIGGDTNLHTDLVAPDGAHGDDIAIWETFLDATGLTDACTALNCPDVGSIDKIAYRSGGGVKLTAIHHEMPVDRFRYDQGTDLSDHPPLAVGFTWDALAG